MQKSATVEYRWGIEVFTFSVCQVDYKDMGTANEFAEYESELEARGLEISPIGPVSRGECSEIMEMMALADKGIRPY